MDGRVPEHSDSHASSSRGSSLESIFKRREDLGKRREDLGKHNVHNHFPETPKLRDLQADQNFKGPLQKTQWRSRTSCRKFW